MDDQIPLSTRREPQGRTTFSVTRAIDAPAEPGCLSLDQIEKIAASSQGHASSCEQDLAAMADLAEGGSWHHIEQCDVCRRKLDECRANQNFLHDMQRLVSDVGQTRRRGVPGVDAIAGYKIIREIHRGGQGVVYEAIQESTKRTVAVKVMLEGPFAGERPRWRFEREVTLVARLKHPNIVAIHDSGIAEGRYYFAMDFVRGHPLDTHVRLTGPSLHDTVGLFTKIVDAVSYAHRHGIIHRDLKPSNILVGEEGDPQVLDFGLAKLTAGEMQESQQGLNTIPGHAFGTVRYMSPEQTRGDLDAIDTRTDVYSLGVILYELVVGFPPYETSGELMAAFRNIQETDPPRPSKLRRDVSNDLDAIILKAMHKDPARRYAAAEPFKEDLVAWLEGRAVTAKSDSSFYVLRKLAARHYFHSSVILALVAAIVGFSGVSFHYLQQTRAALHERDVSLTATRIAYQDMERFWKEAIGQQALGWFLLDWENGRIGSARAIQAQAHQGTPEYAAMAFLLGEGTDPEQFRAKLRADAGAVFHFILGEKHLKAGRGREAIAEYELSVRATEGHYDRYRQAAAARLEELTSASSLGQTRGLNLPKTVEASSRTPVATRATSPGGSP